jgi:hypothetical protein
MIDFGAIKVHKSRPTDGGGKYQKNGKPHNYEKFGVRKC